MRRKAIILLLCLTALLNTQTSFAGKYKDTAIDKVGDWFATLGKEKNEKGRIIWRRQSSRESAWRKKQAGEKAQESRKHESKPVPQRTLSNPAPGFTSDIEPKTAGGISAGSTIKNVNKQLKKY